LSSAEAWEAAGQTAHEHVQAFELGAVAESWLRLIRGEPLDGGPAYQLSGAQSAG
jgi:hypothetical protein